MSVMRVGPLSLLLLVLALAAAAARPALGELLGPSAVVSSSVSSAATPWELLLDDDAGQVEAVGGGSLIIQPSNRTHQWSKCEGATEVERVTSHALNIGAALLSIIGSVLTLIAFKWYYGLPSGSVPQGSTEAPFVNGLIQMLAFCDLAAAAGMFASNLVLMTNGYESGTLCGLFRIVIQFFVVATFCWTSAIALQIYLEYTRQMVMSRRTYLFFHLVCWAIPLADVMPLVLNHYTGVMHVDSAGWCTLERVPEWILWLGPLFLALAWNLIFYVRVFIFLRKSFRDFPTERVVVTGIQRKLSLYLILLVLCWIWDALNHSLEFASICPPFALYALQDFFTPLQGFLNFIIFTAGNPMIQMPLLRICRRGGGGRASCCTSARERREHDEISRLVADVQRYNYDG